MLSSLSRKISAALPAVAFLMCAALPAFAASRAVVRRVPPVYPQLAKMMHVEGVVRVEATVAANGDVTKAKAISGNKMLAPAAEYAIEHWKFAPAAAPSVESIAIDFEDNE